MKINNLLTVYPAEPYEFGRTGSLGNASYMYICQYNFPHQYIEGLDIFITKDSDRLGADDYDRCNAVFIKHTGKNASSTHAFEDWAIKNNNKLVMAFLIDILKPEINHLERLDFTGYRILATVDGGGHAIWTFQLFIKSPESNTIVYSGNNAPNILSGRR